MKIEVNVRKNYVIISIIAIFLTIGIIAVYAIEAGKTPDPGHSTSEIGAPATCVAGQVLAWDGNNWICTTLPGSPVIDNTGNITIAYDTGSSLPHCWILGTSYAPNQPLCIQLNVGTANPGIDRCVLEAVQWLSTTRHNKTVYDGKLGSYKELRVMKSYKILTTSGGGCGTGDLNDPSSQRWLIKMVDID